VRRRANQKGRRREGRTPKLPLHLEDSARV
jgi:hypothetical protein